MKTFTRLFILVMLISLPLTSCATPSTPPPVSTPTVLACSVSDAEWAKPQDDSAIENPPVYEYFYINEDRSIWASAWWTDEKYPLKADEEGNKVGWFRPAGAKLEVTGRRLDGDSPPMQAEVPCCYPTRFQVTGLIFPTPGCWEVAAKAADSVLIFTVKVEP